MPGRMPSGEWDDPDALRRAYAKRAAVLQQRPVGQQVTDRSDQALPDNRGRPGHRT